MRWMLLAKVAFWMIIIGVVALVTPNPAWPSWVGGTVLGIGILMAVVGAVVSVIKTKQASSKNTGDSKTQ